MNSFNKSILNWCKLHPDDSLSQYYMKSFKKAEAMRGAEKKRWSEIAAELIDRSQVSKVRRQPTCGDIVTVGNRKGIIIQIEYNRNDGGMMVVKFEDDSKITLPEKRLVKEPLERILSYFEKLRNSEISFCDGQELEYVKEAGCYACHSEYMDKQGDGERSN
jgi:hypothetical protein